MKTNDTVKLFSLFHAKYGHRWTSAYPDAGIIRLAVDVWTKALADFPDEWIVKGTDDWKGDWPPSLPEFQKVCLPAFKELGIDIFKMAEERASAGDMFNWNRLPSDTQNRRFEKAEREIVAEMQESMISNPGEHAAKALEAPNGEI